MILDRKLPPLSTHIDELNFIRPHSTFFENGNSLHCILKDDTNVAKIEIQYDAGYIYQSKSALATCVNNMLLEGTGKMNSKEIAEYFDQEGAFLENSCTAEKASITLYCLRKKVKKTAHKLFEILDTANFEQQEIDTYLSVKKQKFLVDNEKMSFKARNNFLDILIGSTNSYANQINIDDFDNIEREDLVKFYDEYYLKGKKQIFVSGGVDNEDIYLFNDYLKVENNNERNGLSTNFEISTDGQKQLIIKSETAIQTAIRMGCITFGKEDSRFPQLFMLNTLLGGYFGSRLMKNIREDKGYTYGIGSGIVSFKKLSYLIIVTEVGSNYTKPTMSEIFKEMDRIKQEEISEQELNLVKNYILGNLLRGFDGSYEAMDRFKGLFNFGLDYKYYENFIKQIKGASSRIIMELAHDVFDQSRIKTVLAGNL